MRPATRSRLEEVELCGRDPFLRALAEERRLNVARGNLTRALAISVFFALFAVYCAIAWVVLWATRRSDRVAQLSRLAIAGIDMPMVFLLIRDFVARDPYPSGPAAFAVGTYVALVILAALALNDRVTFSTAGIGAVLG